MPRMVLPPINEADGVLDELQAWFLVRAEAESWVYTSVLRQLVNRMYRDRDYLEKRRAQGQRTAYDYAVDRDLKALAWAIRELVRHEPAEEKARPEPPSRRASLHAASPRPSAPRRRGDRAGTESRNGTGMGPTCHPVHHARRSPLPARLNADRPEGDRGGVPAPSGAGRSPARGGGEARAAGPSAWGIPNWRGHPRSVLARMSETRASLPAPRLRPRGPATAHAPTTARRREPRSR